jgi:acetyl-CoA carboxylase biotin carboxyl carrier protein
LTLSAADIKSLIADFQSSDWDSMTLRDGTVEIVISRSGGFPAPPDAPTPERILPAATNRSDSTAPVREPEVGPPAAATVQPTSTAAEVVAPSGVAVTSPTVGLFWRSPKPGAPPFVEIGQHVGVDDTVCIIEVMKLMQQVKAGLAGTVVVIEPDTGAMVEHGTRLMVIEPDA